MAIIKISELTELTTPADGDFLVVNDISEALDVDKTKKITFANALLGKISKSLFTAVGDILYATGSATPAVLAKPAADSVLKMTSGGVPSWLSLVDLAVALIYRRQGGSATHWNTAGTTTYTPPTGAKIQTGMIEISVSSTTVDIQSVVFPVAFTYKPLVFLTKSADAYVSNQMSVQASLVSETGFNIYTTYDTPITVTSSVAWLAIGE